MSTRYMIGDLVRIDAYFTETISGAPVDPAVVTVQYRPEGGTITSLEYGIDPEVVRDAQGHYHFDILLSMAGAWAYRIVGEGTNQAAGEGTVLVRQSMFD